MFAIGQVVRFDAKESGFVKTTCDTEPLITGQWAIEATKRNNPDTLPYPGCLVSSDWRGSCLTLQPC